MKNTILLYVLALLATLPTAGYTFTLSEEIPEGVNVTSIVLEGNNNLTSDHYICLGDGWEKVNLKISTQIKDLKSLHPNLLKDMGEAQKNCFAPAEVPQISQKAIEDILASIDSGAGDKFHVTVGTSGEPTLTNESIEYKKKSQLPVTLSAAAKFGTETNKYSIELPTSRFSKANSEKEFTLRNESSTLKRKLLRAELLIGGAEVLGMGILISLPKAITKWEDDWMDDAKRNLKRAWTTAPVMDKDEFFINYIGHPLAGAAYYNVLRSQGATRMQSLIFSTVQSTIWEYVIEGIAEQPSIQDLIITPLVGSLFGELAHMATLRMRNNGFTLAEKVVVTVINPAYVLNNGFRTKGKK